MYTIERKGTVVIEPNGEPIRCGEVDTREYNYRVRVDVHALTEEGWVLDNRELPRIVAEIAAGNPKSCESFCDAICQEILSRLNERARGVRVEIEGIRDSWIRTYWGDIPTA
jgi:hypothetical protein